MMLSTISPPLSPDFPHTLPQADSAHSSHNSKVCQPGEGRAYLAKPRVRTSEPGKAGGRAGDRQDRQHQEVVAQDGDGAGDSGVGLGGVDCVMALGEASEPVT